jgi:hypothetical protein
LQLFLPPFEVAEKFGLIHWYIRRSLPLFTILTRVYDTYNIYTFAPGYWIHNDELAEPQVLIQYTSVTGPTLFFPTYYITVLPSQNELKFGGEGPLLTIIPGRLRIL